MTRSMRRRQFTPWVGALALPWPLAARAQFNWTISREQLQERLARRFPLRYPLQGLLELTVDTPTLSLLPAVNRLGAVADVSAAGQVLRRIHTGQLELDFALRYEPSNRTVRAHQVRLVRLNFPTLAPALGDAVQRYGPTLVEQTLHEVVLHHAQPQELAVLDTLGLQPGPMVVTPKGVRVDLVRAQ